MKFRFFTNYLYSTSIFIALLLSPLFSACKTDKKRVEAERIVKEWIGKEIRFPKNLPCSVFGKETLLSACNDLFDFEYKLLLYVDSTGCSSCRLRLIEWKELMVESDTLLGGKLSFLFYFQPKKIGSRDLEQLFRRNRFDHPVFIDANNRIDSLNRFSMVADYQCFLLDKNNKVLMIGNPLLNPKIWELIKKQVGEIPQTSHSDKTTVKIDKTLHDFGTIKKGSRNQVVFTITNTGKSPLVLYSVNASCGCTHVKWDKQPVGPQKTTKIVVDFVPEDVGFFSKSIVVSGNMINTPLSLKVFGQTN